MHIPIAKIEFMDGDVDQHKLTNVKDSIKDKGLLHPIIVQKVNSSGTFKLVTGRYRLLAVRALEETSIEADVREPMDELESKELHLHENLKRGQLPWYEEVELTKQLHELRQIQHGAGVAGNPHEGKKGWGMRDTANELGKALGGVSQEIQLANLVRQNPALKNIKDKQTALKVVKQTVKRMYAEEEAILSGDVDFADDILLGEAGTILSQLPENLFNFCITDPPWFKFAKQEDPTLRRDEFTLPVFKELFRVMKWDSFLYLFCGEDDFTFFKKELPPQGWKVQGHPCIWAKQNFLSRTGVKSWEHGRDLEMILVAVKGSPVLSSSSQVSSIFQYPVVPSVKLRHPNEKPLELIAAITRNCSYVGSLGIDPFAGSGAHLEAMHQIKRHFFGIERDPERFKGIKERMGKLK